MKRTTLSERCVILAPSGRDAAVAAQMLIEAGFEAHACPSLPALIDALDGGAGFVLVTEEALATADLHRLSRWIEEQQEWSDLPFILLTQRGGGLERNPSAGRYLGLLGNVTFLERPFHPTTLVSLAQSALRGRRRQYEARARLQELHDTAERLRDLTASLEQRIEVATAERARIGAQLHEAQKLETLGQLTGGVAHDFNNLLTPITGALDLLIRRQDGSDPRTMRLIEGALQSAERAKTLVQRLLGFARRQTLQPRAVDLAALVNNMRDLIASSIGSGIELRIAPAADLPAALVDPNQLELAVLNLCVNARDAMPSGGVLTVGVEQAMLGPGATPKLPPGAYLRLSVIDTGSGMDEATLARAIEPFFSTKDIGRGTGLGLSMVHGLAAQLGGAFALSSALGEGTRADLYLPVAEALAEARPVRTEPKAAARARPLSILLVDDEDLVRAGTAEMLRDLGHAVIEARGGAEALARLDSGHEFDILVTDFMMPRMDGAELGRLVRARAPDMPVLVITGYAGGDLELDLPQLAKPFRQGDLAAILQVLIDGESNVVPLPSRSR